MFEDLFKGQIDKVIAGEGEVIEKAAFSAKALVDYALAQLNGITITVRIDTHPVKKAEPVE